MARKWIWNIKSNRATRDELINNFVSKLLESYPALVLQ